MEYGNNYESICLICKEKGFHKRGVAFFRIVGDGVLQVVKYHYHTSPWQQEYLSIGIFSMYSELMPHWLTAGGCIPRYQVRWLNKIVKDQWVNAFSKSCMDPVKNIYTWRIDVSFIQSTVLPFLDSVDTQCKAVEAMMYLDVEAQEVYGRSVLWNDELKYAPFLRSGDYENATLVIRSILAQHDSAISSNKQHWTAEQYQQFLSTYELEVQKLHNLLRLAEERNPDEINQYLQTNYERNVCLTKFMYSR